MTLSLIIIFLQLMRLNAKGQLGVGERCIDADSSGVKLIFCRLGTVDGPWQYDEVSFILYDFAVSALLSCDTKQSYLLQTTRLLLHSTHKKCMAVHPQTLQLILAPCDPNDNYHHWTFKEIHPNW